MKNFIKILSTGFLYLFILNSVSATAQNAVIEEIPNFIQVFLIVNLLMLMLAPLLVFEVRRVSLSQIWSQILFSNFWNIIHTIALAMLLNFRYSYSNIYILLLIASLYTIGVTMVNVTEYFLITPLLKKRPSLLRREYLPIYLGFLLVWYFSNKAIGSILFPIFNNIIILYLFLVCYLGLVIYFIYSTFYISKSFSEIGFVYKPFLAGGIGAVSIFIMFFVILLNSTKYQQEYYYLLLLFVSSAFTFIGYFNFIIEYPSLLQPKWKTLLPFSLIKVAATITFAFLAISLYFSTIDLGFSSIIPFWALVIVGLIFVPVAALFVYARAFTGETTLGYWSYLKTEIAGHMGLTFYVLSIAIIVWGFLGGSEKLLFGVFFGLSFLFYVATALDIRKLTKELRVKVKIEPLTLIRYLVSIFSSFFIIYFLVFLTKGKLTTIDSTLQKYTLFPLILIGIFFIFYFTILKRTHKGFEQLMKKGTITDISYLSSLGVFIALFLLYLRIRGPASLLSQFPLFGTVFIGYFAILIADVYSSITLRVKEYKEKKDIIDLLHHIAGHFFRTDILEKMWNEVVDLYKDIDPELEKARFYPPERTFDLDMVNEKTRVTASFAMLRKMEAAAGEKDSSVVPFDDDVGNETQLLLGEKILLLPDEFLKDYKVDIYYPKLFEATLKRINEAIEPFVSIEDYGAILKKLVSIDLFFNNLAYDKSGLKVKKGIELSRKEFIKYFKLYIQALENTFPFNRLLLRETVKSEVQMRLSLYGVTIADILNVVPIGIKEFDEVLYGGLIKGTSTLLLSEERRAKNDVLVMFTLEGLKEKEAGIFATSRVSSKDLLKVFKSVLDPGERLQIIDLYLSTHTDNVVRIPVSKENLNIISSSLIDVRQAVVASVKKFPKEAHKRVVLDIYSDLSRYHSRDEILDLIITQVDGFKRWNSTSIVTLNPDLASEDLERHFDNVFLLTDVATIKIKKLFGGKPKKQSFIIWGTYSPIEEPDYSLVFGKLDR
jgi:KaiC/GvpD/RAD55 family RecA-like ATPase